MKPFGDDSFLLHQIETKVIGNRRICWNPESLLNWRQRRSALRRKERGYTDEAKPAENKPAAEPKAKPAPVDQAKEATPVRSAENKPQTSPAEVKPTKQEAEKPTRAEASKAKGERSKEPKAEAPKAAPKPQAENEETALPIGAHLDILDQDLSFDQQLSRLAQPLSTGANRLSAEQESQPEEAELEAPTHFNGTPLNRNARQITRSVRKPQSVHHVVERHMVQSGALQGEQATYQMVENPIERLLVDFEYVWQSPQLRQRALTELLGNETFVQDMLQAFRSRNFSTRATVVAQEQLSEIEAERLDLLMQLEEAKSNEKQYREKALASLSHKMRGESERLQREVATLEKTRDTLQSATQAMSQEVSDKIHEYMSQHVTCMGGCGENHVLLSPVVGKRYEASQLAETLRQHMNNNGFAINDDDAASLLVLFSVSDAFCLQADTIEDGCRFANLMMESLGLKSVSAVLKPDCNVELVSLLPETKLRTPTVTIQPIGTETMSVFGHKTIYLADANEQIPLFMPVFRAPRHLRQTFGRHDEWQAVQPASLESFQQIRMDSHPLLAEAEKWFSDLKSAMVQQQITVPDVTLEDMRRFMESGMRRVRGGFVAAADIAVCQWIAPVLLRTTGSASQMRQVLSGLPRTLELLNIE